jgi:transposase
MPRKKKSKKSKLPSKSYRGYRARSGGQTLRSWTVGGLPIINRLLERIGLEGFLEKHLPPDDPRTVVPTSRGLLLLIRNILLSREPMYGLGEWAERYTPDLLGLCRSDLNHLNDDRVGRCLDRLFDTPLPELVMDVVRHVVQEFDVSLQELHNDSTTVSFYGAYEEASAEGSCRGRPTLAITFGHSKARRPDLKQLLYTLTVTNDGAVPVYFTSASGNVTDDTTHCETWDLLRELVGRPDFLYVADCKLATSENMKYIASRGGRFVSVLPRSRREDTEFRRRLIDTPQTIPWEPVYDVTNEDGELVDRFQVCAQELVSGEGFRLLWFFSTRKKARDAATRARVIDRTLKALEELQQRLHSPKTRFRQRAKVAKEVEEVLRTSGGARWVPVEIEALEKTQYKQATRGRPNQDTKYVKRVTTRFRLAFAVDPLRVAEDQASDGVFPLISNEREQAAAELLRAYKRQPFIEKRFSQFKTDFEVAPMYLQSVSRIQALMCVYFFVLLVQTLLERELRRAMVASKLDCLPLYPEGRDCGAPTTRRVLDVFESVQRHELGTDGETEVFVTQLTPLQREIARLFGLSPRSYGH